MRFFLNWLVDALAVAIACALIPGIAPYGFTAAWVSFAFVGLFLGIVNTLVKPFVSAISLPATILTLGIFQLVVNAFMLELASFLSVSILDCGISISSFGAAFFGSIIVSIASAVLNGVFGTDDAD